VVHTYIRLHRQGKSLHAFLERRTQLWSQGRLGSAPQKCCRHMEKEAVLDSLDNPTSDAAWRQLGPSALEHLGTFKSREMVSNGKVLAFWMAVYPA